MLNSPVREAPGVSGVSVGSRQIWGTFGGIGNVPPLRAPPNAPDRHGHPRGEGRGQAL
jgi:hypothetical protein